MVPYPVALGELSEQCKRELQVILQQAVWGLSGCLCSHQSHQDASAVVPYCVVFGVLV